MAEELAPPSVVRALQLVGAASDKNVQISASEIAAFVNTRVPRSQNKFAAAQSLAYAAYEMFGGSTIEGVAEYLERVSWIREEDPVDGGYVITQLGRAVLAHSTSSGEDVFEVTVRPDTPTDYVALLTHVASLDDVLYVDRYVPTPMAAMLARQESVARILTTANPVSSAGEKSWPIRTENLRTALGLLEREGHAVEIRAASSSPAPFHDRLVLPGGNARGLLLGGSVGGEKSNTIVQLTPEMTAHLRATHEEVWVAAEVVEAAEAD